LGCCRYRPLLKSLLLSFLCCSSCPVVVLWKDNPQWGL
ncbi:hypothetical protein N325_01306, partial [Colius striatus]